MLKTYEECYLHNRVFACRRRATSRGARLSMVSNLSVLLQGTRKDRRGSNMVGCRPEY